MQIIKDKTGVINYTVKDENGKILEKSEEKKPLTYTHGYNTLMPGMESALEGKSAGESLSITVTPQEGYGEVSEDLIEEVPISKFTEKEKVKPGSRFNISTDKWKGLVTIMSVDGDTVTVDFNNPLAGKTLNIDIEVIDVRDATTEEIKRTHEQLDMAIDELKK